MNVLTLSSYDYDGGASRAAYRLHRGLVSEGIQSQMLVSGKFSTDRSVIGPSSKLAKGLSLLRPEVDAFPLRFYPGRTQAPWSLAWFPSNINSQVETFAPDLVHLHWVGFGFVPIAALSRLKKPIIWTLHDMWPFTGGCHYAGHCTRYKQSCGMCPQLGSRWNRDLSSWVIRRKSRLWQGIDLTIVTPSRWLANCATSSRLFSDLRVEVIPNGLDLSVFKPLDKIIARKLLNLPVDRKLVLLGAINLTGESRKGFGLLQAAAARLAGSSLSRHVEFLVVGCGEPEKPVDLGFEVHYLGRWHDDISLALLYNAADVFVSPSVQDNLPNTIMEALACGTPCVAFDIGGMPDMISHRQNGYLSKPLDPLDLADGLEWVLQDEQRAECLSKHARAKVEREFSLGRIAGLYHELYKELLAEST